MAQKNKTQGFIAALLIVLLLGLLFAINWEKISSNMQETNFLEIVFKKNEASVSEQTEKPEPITDSIQIETEQVKEQEQLTAAESVTVQAQVDDITKVASENTKQNIVESESEDIVTQVTPPPSLAKEEKQNATLYFIQIDTNGTIVRKELSRPLTASNSPLTNSILALLSGPTKVEEEQGLRSLIPEGTKLLSVTVQNNTAILNFSEEFEFNSFGSDGYRGQLMQVVYTATAFSTVENVQLLIEGSHKQFLGSEGVWIGSPLNRNNFIW